MPGALDGQAFVMAIGQRRVGLRMATIKRNEKRPFRIDLLPYVTIFRGVIVLVVRSSRSKLFVFVEVFQFTLPELVNDTPNIVRFITQDVRDAASPPDRHAGKGQPM